jgi:hypothetical protein
MGSGLCWVSPPALSSRSPRRRRKRRTPGAAPSSASRRPPTDPTPAPVGSTTPYMVTYSASLRGFAAYSPSQPYVYWTAFGRPDSTGASSGHPAGDLTDVVVIAETA